MPCNMNHTPNTYKVVITFEADDLPELYDHLGAPGVIAGKCTVSVLSLSPHNHMSETIAAPTELM